MLLTLVSQHLVFEAGEVYAWPKGSLPTSHEGTSLRSNLVDDPAIARAGVWVLLCFNCVIQSRTSELVRTIPSFSVEAVVTDTALEAGAAEIPVGFHAFARIEVAGSARERLSGQPVVVGIALDEYTIEAQINEQGHLDVLLPRGDYLAYVLQQSPPVTTRIRIQEGQEDAGIFTLTESAPGPP